ncbi:Uncharacterised protein [Anaerostipes hadrus]|nr:Uncharacterised protein [Anaerostipes hadrus]
MDLKFVIDCLADVDHLTKSLYFIKKNKVGYTSYSPEIQS